jgi:hypothetical protein
VTSLCGVGCFGDTGKECLLTGSEDPVYKPILEIAIFFCSSLHQPAVHRRIGVVQPNFVNEGNFEEKRKRRRGRRIYVDFASAG